MRAFTVYSLCQNINEAYLHGRNYCGFISQNLSFKDKLREKMRAPTCCNLTLFCGFFSSSGVTFTSTFNPFPASARFRSLHPMSILPIGVLRAYINSCIYWNVTICSGYWKRLSIVDSSCGSGSFVYLPDPFLWQVHFFLAFNLFLTFYVPCISLSLLLSFLSLSLSLSHTLYLSILIYQSISLRMVSY